MQVHYAGQTGMTLRKGRKLPVIDGPLLMPLATGECPEPIRMLWKLIYGEEYVIINGGAFSLMLLPGCKRDGETLILGKHSRLRIHTHCAAMIGAVVEYEEELRVTTYGLAAFSADSP